MAKQVGTWVWCKVKVWNYKDSEEERFTRGFQETLNLPLLNIPDAREKTIFSVLPQGNVSNVAARNMLSLT